MGTVAARARREAARVLGTLGAAGADPDRFARLGVTELPRLVASELTTLSVCDLATGRRRVVGNGGISLSADDIAAFDRHFRGHPLVRFHARNPGGGTHRISDSLSRREFVASPLYDDYYRRVGIDHAAAVPLHVDDTTLVSFVLNRAGRDFSDDDVALLERLRGWLATMYGNAIALQRAAGALAQVREIAEAEDWAIVRLDARRRIRELSAPAAAMLAGASPGAKPRAGAALPGPIEAWLECAARGWAPPLALAPLVLRGTRGRVTVRALPELSGEAGWVLLVRGEGGTAALRPAGEALTPREREVLRWVAAGKTDRQIGEIVGVSFRTVQKHLEHAYVKLGVENRTAAAMRAAGVVGRPAGDS